MDQHSSSFVDWLNEQAPGMLMIEKREGRDTDRVELLLESASVRQHERSPDDYIAKTSIVLHGKGTIAGDRAGAPLPGDAYVIPMDGVSEGGPADGGFVLSTERAVYRINRLPLS